MTKNDDSGRGKPASRGRGGAPGRPGAGGKPRGKPFASRPAGGKPRAVKPAGEERAQRGGKAHARPPRKDGASARKPRESVPETVEADGTPVRIAKMMARAGVASRRDAERMIGEGRVAVNGATLDSPAVTVTRSDTVTLDGEAIAAAERTRLWLYHKPAGLVSTNSDPEGRPTVFDRLPADLPRVLSVGRLDIATEGLLLLTNDGGLARVLELPSTGWLRRYRVRAHGDIDQPALDALKEGIVVNGVIYGAIEAVLERRQGSNVWLSMGLREGKNREIKNVLGALGLAVNRLIRISYGPFQLADLAQGEAREIRGRMLRDQLGPRLIREAGADFDAPVHEREADGRLVEPQKPSRRASDDAGKAERSAPPARRSAREDRDDRREKARDRLDTRPAREEKGPPKRKLGNRNRASNVWMAPGARPVAPKKAAAAAQEEGAIGTGKRSPAAGRTGKAAHGAAKPERPFKATGNRDRKPTASTAKPSHRSRPDDDRRPTHAAPGKGKEAPEGARGERRAGRDEATGKAPSHRRDGAKGADRKGPATGPNGKSGRLKAAASRGERKPENAAAKRDKPKGRGGRDADRRR
ncbi:pseudouridine synthase [Pararhizobium mangrovi]|uniref:Pseudouridine synthase n=1 Tax=Pararhizobium mangrovi TaxID=2590452 RepID=A0A506U0T6_9HYPH|nr:pseudouridine synthase [Pararhizobium mangrovi]TPW26594.1 pseudouridine synthase [Pararhizobium mangrovi]